MRDSNIKKACENFRVSFISRKYFCYETKFLHLQLTIFNYHFLF